MPPGCLPLGMDTPAPILAEPQGHGTIMGGAPETTANLAESTHDTACRVIEGIVTRRTEDHMTRCQPSHQRQAGTGGAAVMPRHQHGQPGGKLAQQTSLDIAPHIPGDQQMMLADNR